VAGPGRVHLGVAAAAATSSSWEPTSTIRPSSTTTIRSAFIAVVSRWAIRTAVRASSRTSRAASIFVSESEVEVRGRLVEHEHARVGEEGAGERDQLALAGGERLAALVDDGVEPVGHPLDDVGEADRATASQTSSSVASGQAKAML
jgi:hypothetical protein